MWNNNKKPNFSAIQKDIDDNFLDLTSSVKDVYVNDFKPLKDFL